MNDSKKKVVVLGLISAAIFMIVVVVIIGVIGSQGQTITDSSGNVVKGESLSDLMKRVRVDTATPTKASVSVMDNNLYDELPEIDKYPLKVEGHGDVDIEIFTSGEKAGTGNDAWLIDCANSFNNANNKTSSGKTISLSVRSVSSGLAADYIISEKYLPDLYTPSNILFGEYAIVNGGKLELYNARLVGNTAGLLVRKGSGYTDTIAVINDVMAGKINIGYTNPQTSATGLNLLLDILKRHGAVTSDEAVNAFAKFNNNIPFVAYTTQQMATSAANGSLDGMTMEYQTYINDANLQSMYDFIAFGLRHDNPLYLVDKMSKSSDELEAIEMISKYLVSSDMQKIASKYGFNNNEDYKDSYSAVGSEVTQALKTYKTKKDNGKDIIAVFVADCSGSMAGEAIMQLKESLSNGMQYINENNYVGLVSYSSWATIEVPIAPFDFNQKAYFQGAINGLTANGGTASYEAICVALDMIEKAKVDHPDAKCMVFLLTDGYANGTMSINSIKYAVVQSEVPIYTIGYTDQADMASLKEVSGINEAASINADSDDIIYQIKSLFNAQL